MLEITQLPFNSHLGLAKCTDGEHLLKLPFANHLTNHLGTLHASALFALAEASSGEFLIRNLDDQQLNAVVRKSSGKYSAPATGEVVARSLTSPSEIHDALATVQQRGRAIVEIQIEITAESSGDSVGRFSFDWFLANQ